MLQDVASHYISELGRLTTLRTTALKSPSRNYPIKSKYKFETKIHSCNVASPSVSCKTCNILLQVHQSPAGARVEMARAKKANAPPNNTTLESADINLSCQLRCPVVSNTLVFNRSSDSIGSESFERSPPTPAHPYPALTRSRSAWNTAGRGPSPRAVIARSVCVPGWNGGGGVAEFAKYLAVPSYLSNSPPRSGTQPRYRFAYCG